MGNLYTNFLLSGTNPEHVVNFLRDKGRSAIVTCNYNETLVLYDKYCDDQDIEEIERFGKVLSSKFDGTILSTLNHDDDHLLLRLFRDGCLIAKYDSFLDAFNFSIPLSRSFGKSLTSPAVFFVLVAPWLFLEIFRHHLLASVLVFPPWSVGFGYRYIESGEMPKKLTENDIISI